MASTVIFNASSVPLNQNPGTLPNVADAIQGYFQPMVFTNITKSIANFQNVETPTSVDFQGCWQPFSPEQLAMKPPGERSWKWFMLHAEPTLELQTDDVVTYESVQYRVTQRMDYSKYGYLMYELLLDYRGSGPNT